MLSSLSDNKMDHYLHQFSCNDPNICPSGSVVKLMWSNKLQLHLLDLELEVITNYTMQLHLLKDKVWWS